MTVTHPLPFRPRRPGRDETPTAGGEPRSIQALAPARDPHPIAPTALRDRGPRPQRPALPRTLAPGAPAPRVLIVEDDPQLRTLLRITLGTSALQVVEAADGAEGVEMFRRHRPDILIVDWMMPALTGVELTRTVRAEQGDHAPYIVMVTARDRPEDLESGLAAGVSQYLTKPFSPLQLIEIVETALAAALP